MAYMKHAQRSKDNPTPNVVAVADDRVEDLKKDGFVLTDAEGNELEKPVNTKDIDAMKKDLKAANTKVTDLEKALKEQTEKAAKDLEAANKKVAELEKAAKK